MREDVVRLSLASTDLRYRGEFDPWSTTLTISYVAGNISAEQLANLLVRAGIQVGVGEWRPEKDGRYGTWTVH